MNIKDAPFFWKQDGGNLEWIWSYWPWIKCILLKNYQNKMGVKIKVSKYIHVQLILIYIGVPII